MLSIDGVISYSDEHFWRHSSRVLCGTIHVQLQPDSSEQKVVAQVCRKLLLLLFDVLLIMSGGVLAWLSDWSEGADLRMSQLMPLPLTVSCFSKIQIGFSFQVPAHPGDPGKRLLNGCVCVSH